MRHASAGSVYRTAARLALTAGVLAVALCAWEVVSVRSGAADAQAAATAAQSDAAVAQAITVAPAGGAEQRDPADGDLPEATACSQRAHPGLGAGAGRARRHGRAAAAARLRVEAQLLDAQIHKLVAATAASDGQVVVDSNAHVQRLASSMRSAVGRQQQLDTQAAHSNLQSLRSSRPVLIWLLIAVLALAAAALLTFGPGRGSGRTSTVRRRGDQPAPRGGPSPG